MKLTQTPYTPVAAGAIAGLAGETGRTLFGALEIVLEAHNTL